MRKHRWFSSWAELDLRSLAVFRILLGLCLSVDLFQKLIYAKDFYSDWGLMPRTYWVTEYMNSWKISLLLANGEAWFQYLVIFIALLSAIAFTVGFKTRISQIIAVILLGSIQSRNYLILSCADDLLRLALFWSLITPLDYYYAVTKRDLSSLGGQTRTASIGTGLLILQLVIMYIVTAFYKLNPTWTVDHSAIYYALNIDHFTTPVGQWLKQFIGLGQFLTETTLIWEFVGPLLLFIPIFSKQLRTFVALGFIFFHLGLAICLNLGTFPWIAMAYWTLFLPGELWATLFAKLDALFNLRPLVQTVPTSSLGAAWKRHSVEGVFAILMVLVIYQNIADLNKDRMSMPPVVRHVLYSLNLNQIWDMFAPYPIRNDGWFVIEGHFKNGETRDLLTGKQLTNIKPPLVADLYVTSEWRKFYLNLWDEGSRRILLPYARYLCRSQVATGEESPLSTLKITFMKETTPPIGLEFPPVEAVSLWSHDCFAP